MDGPSKMWTHLQSASTSQTGFRSETSFSEQREPKVKIARICFFLPAYQCLSYLASSRKAIAEELSYLLKDFSPLNWFHFWRSWWSDCSSDAVRLEQVMLDVVNRMMGHVTYRKHIVDFLLRLDSFSLLMQLFQQLTVRETLQFAAECLGPYFTGGAIYLCSFLHAPLCRSRATFLQERFAIMHIKLTSIIPHCQQRFDPWCHLSSRKPIWLRDDGLVLGSKLLTYEACSKLDVCPQHDTEYAIMQRESKCSIFVNIFQTFSIYLITGCCIDMLSEMRKKEHESGIDVDSALEQLMTKALQALSKRSYMNEMVEHLIKGLALQDCADVSVHLTPAHLILCKADTHLLCVSKQSLILLLCTHAMSGTSCLYGVSFGRTKWLGSALGPIAILRSQRMLLEALQGFMCRLLVSLLVRPNVLVYVSFFLTLQDFGTRHIDWYNSSSHLYHKRPLLRLSPPNFILKSNWTFCQQINCLFSYSRRFFLTTVNDQKLYLAFLLVSISEISLLIQCHVLCLDPHTSEGWYTKIQVYLAWNVNVS